MPRLGMEPLRRDALIRAAIGEVGQVGSLDVTMNRIARRAGVSAALAHHYFGSKDRLLLAAMRFILREFGASVRARLEGRRAPRERLRAVIEASFAPDQFDREVVGAWLAFYVLAQTSDEAARLLRVYSARLHANLMHDLGRLAPRASARSIAQGLAAMIDGFYIRCALQAIAPDRAASQALVLDYLEMRLEREGAHGGATA